MDNTAEVIDLTRRLPTSEEIDNAAEAATALANACAKDGTLEIKGMDSKSVRLAPAIANLMIELLGHLTRGDMVTLVPTGAELTTQEAADILNVSRHYLSELLKEGKIPCSELGTHRRINFNDLIQYKKERDSDRSAALAELAQFGQEFDAS